MGAAATPVVSGGAIADNKYDAVPSGGTAVGEIACNYQQAVAGVVSTHAEVAIHDDRHWIGRGHRIRHLSLSSIATNHNVGRIFYGLQSVVRVQGRIQTVGKRNRTDIGSGASGPCVVAQAVRGNTGGDGRDISRIGGSNGIFNR